MTWDTENIYIKCDLGVNVDPPQPFAAMPNSLLESTGSAVLLGCLNLIGRAFARALAADFERWRSDAAYRRERAGGSPAVFLLHAEKASDGSPAVLPDAEKDRGGSVAVLLKT